MFAQATAGPSVFEETGERPIVSSEPELVSVIIPTRNRPELLQRAVASVVAQDYRPIQLLIIDNRSDSPVQVDAADLDCIVLRNPSIMNVSVNRNVGVRLSSGSLVCFLDDDDEYLPGKLPLLAGALDEVSFCFGNTQMLGANGVTLKTIWGGGDRSTYVVPIGSHQFDLDAQKHF